MIRHLYKKRTYKKSLLGPIVSEGESMAFMCWGQVCLEAGRNVTEEHLRTYIRTYNPEAERGREGEIGRQGKERVVCCGV